MKPKKEFWKRKSFWAAVLGTAAVGAGVVDQDAMPFIMELFK